jgi:hypothetical protein
MGLQRDMAIVFSLLFKKAPLLAFDSIQAFPRLSSEAVFQGCLPSFPRQLLASSSLGKEDLACGPKKLSLKSGL